MFEFIGTLIMCVIIFVIACFVSSYRCENQFPSMLPQWKLGVGCTINVDGIRIPSENYRVM